MINDIYIVCLILTSRYVYISYYIKQISKYFTYIYIYFRLGSSKFEIGLDNIYIFYPLHSKNTYSWSNKYQ
jgi:hypothetical protein